MNCDKCNFSTTYKSKWEEHLKTKKHLIEKEDYFCEKCDYSTKYKSKWDEHCESIKHNKQVYNCDKCNNVYENEFDLIKHSKIHVILTPDEISKKIFKKWIQYHIHKHYRVPINEPTENEINNLLQYGYEYDKKPTNIEVFEEITEINKKHITYHIHKECGFPVIEPTDEDRRRLLPMRWEQRP